MEENKKKESEFKKQEWEKMQRKLAEKRRIIDQQQPEFREGFHQREQSPHHSDPWEPAKHFHDHG